MKNCKGFSLIETLISLFILTTVISVIVPAIIIVQNERTNIRLERFVEQKLNHYYERAFFQNEAIDEKIEYKGIIFHAASRKERGDNFLCITWTGRNERQYERCLSSVKKE